MLQNKLMRKQGFSLVEVMIVIVIIGLIAVISHKSLVAYNMRAKVSQAMLVISQYQNDIMSYSLKHDNIDPYNILFPDGDTTGFVSGSPGGNSAVKTLDLKDIDTVSISKVVYLTFNYVVVGVGLKHSGVIQAGADHIYSAAMIIDYTGLNWECGISVSNSDNINADYLPKNCIPSIP